MTILRDLIAAYPLLSFGDKLHMIIRWRVCPLRRIAGYVPSAGVVIDLGCGHGLFTQLLARESAERQVIGVDLDEHKIAVAAQLKFENLQFIAQDIASAELPAAQAVTILDVFYLVPYPVQERLLEVCATKLAASGVIVLKETAEVPRWKMGLTWLEEVLAVRVLKITDHSGDQRFYFRPRAEWQALFTRLGFTVQTIPLDSGYYHPHVLFIARKIN